MEHPFYVMVDCNNFYVSCERAFNPALERRPVVVLSNNDGCIIARSEEAKALGIGMAEPAFKRRAFFLSNDVTVFSSNYALYGDMSSRVHGVLSRFTPEIEHYSIDECFLLLHTKNRKRLFSLAHQIRQQVRQWTGIPVCVGIAHTKTLAKVANRLAKKRPNSGGVWILDDPTQIEQELAILEIEDVWGIGRRNSKKMHAMGVKSALDLTQRTHEWIRKKLTVCGLRTVMELQGIPAIPMEEEPPTAKSITCSRSFGVRITNLSELQEALSCYVQRATEKLRSRKLQAGAVQVFITTARLSDDPQYSNIGTLPLQTPSSYTPELQAKAQTILKDLFRSGFRYQKVGVLLLELVPENGRQLTFNDFLDDSNSKQNKPLMKALDAINQRHGRGTLHFASSGTGKKRWHMNQNKLSKRFTTTWSELPIAFAR